MAGRVFMKTRKQTKREARHLFRLCLANNSLNDNSVRQVVENILKSKRRGHLALAHEFERVVRLHKGPVVTEAAYPVEKLAPGIIRRSPFRQPMQISVAIATSSPVTTKGHSCYSRKRA
jgi:hypothetical protein